MGFEGEDEMSDATEDHCPAEEDRDANAGYRRDEDGEEAGDDQQDAEGDGPVEGFGGEGGE